MAEETSTDAIEEGQIPPDQKETYNPAPHDYSYKMSALGLLKGAIEEMEKKAAACRELHADLEKAELSLAAEAALWDIFTKMR